MIASLFDQMQDNHRTEMRLVTDRLQSMEDMNRDFQDQIKKLTSEVEQIKNKMPSQEDR